MPGRLRFRLPRVGLLFAAQGTAERTNEFLTSNPIGHHPLERTTYPVLILTNQIGRGLCLAHALRGFQCCMSPDMASLEPAIRKVLHRIESLVLNVPETTHIVLKRGRTRHKHHTLHGFQLLCCVVHSVFLHHSTVTKTLGNRNRIRGSTPSLSYTHGMNTCADSHRRQGESNGAITPRAIVNCGCPDLFRTWPEVKCYWDAPFTCSHAMLKVAPGLAISEG